MESLYYFEFCVVILSCCLKIKKKIKKKKKETDRHRLAIRTIKSHAQDSSFA